MATLFQFGFRYTNRNRQGDIDDFDVPCLLSNAVVRHKDRQMMMGLFATCKSLYRALTLEFEACKVSVYGRHCHAITRANLQCRNRYDNRRKCFPPLCSVHWCMLNDRQQNTCPTNRRYPSLTNMPPSLAINFYCRNRKKRLE